MDRGNKMKNVALLISGQARSLDKCYKSIVNTFPDSNVYVHTCLDSDSFKVNLLNPERCLIETDTPINEREEYTKQLALWCPGVQQVLQQLNSLKKVYQLYLDAGCYHDWLVRCRPDIQFTNDIEDFTNWDCDVVLPTFHNWWGFCDRFAIIRRQSADYYFNQLDKLDLYIDSGGKFHTESFLKWNISHLRINRTKLKFNTLRKDGSIIKPTSRPDCGDLSITQINHEILDCYK
jgi:hypothetical protein